VGTSKAQARNAMRSLSRPEDLELRKNSRGGGAGPPMVLAVLATPCELLDALAPCFPEIPNFFTAPLPEGERRVSWKFDSLSSWGRGKTISSTLHSRLERQ